jgi:hypothetical protein
LRTGAFLNRVLPFGGIGKPWVLAVIVISGLLVIAGEFIKAARPNCNCICDGFKNSYILAFQLILLLLIVAVVTLRTCLVLIRNRISSGAYEMFLAEVKKWGIKIKGYL